MTPEDIDAMVAAGATAEVLAALWKSQLAAQARAIEERRAKDRDRQRRHRESRDVTVTDADSADTPAPNKSPPDPQKLTPTPRMREGRARARFAPPDGVSEDQWAGFMSLRAAKRQPMTDRGYSLLCGKLDTLAEHGFPPGEMIDLAIERGWTTVHEPKDAPNGHRQPHPIRGTRPSPALALFKRGAVREAEEDSGQDRAPDWGAGPSLPSVGSG